MKFYAAEKGFGFIVRDRGGKDIFVHASALNRAGITELAEGQRVALTWSRAARDRRRSAFGSFDVEPSSFPLQNASGHACRPCRSSDDPIPPRQRPSGCPRSS